MLKDEINLPDLTMPTRSLSASFDLLQILLKYALQLGITQVDIEKECGLTLSDFQLADCRIPMPTFHSIWSYVLVSSNDPDFGLHFGQQSHQLLSRHLLYAMMMNCQTIHEAIQKNFVYHNLITDIIRPIIQTDSSLAILTWEMNHPVLRQERHFSEAILTLFVSMLRYLTEDQISLKEIRFSHDQPTSIQQHQSIFQAPVLFNQVQNEILLDKNQLEQPLPLANPQLLEDLEHLLQKTIHRVYKYQSWSEKTSQELGRRLIKGKNIDIESVAESLATSERNLQLKLKSEGMNFKKLQDEIRKETAFSSLIDPETSICEIALLLGYADQSAFQHAFKRWTGTTPGLYRKFRTQ